MLDEIPVDPIVRGRRYELFWNEKGGLKDMLAEIRQTYLDRLAQTNPADVQQLQVLALAHRISVEFEGMVRTVINGGDVAQAARDYSTKMAAIPASSRRFM